MKKLFFITILSLAILLKPSVTLAQSMMGGSKEATTDSHTAREEAEGKEIWKKLQAKQLECKNLTDDNFEVLGEYFMGQMAGNSHEAMNNMMERMMGKENEEQMHVLMGKRLSGCDTSAQISSQGLGFMPMMGGLGGFGLGWISMILFWGLIILAIIVFLRWLLSSSKGQSNKTPLEILKERYAKGEIDKKEFEQKKKDLE